jgi:hypothetical protein
MQIDEIEKCSWAQFINDMNEIGNIKNGELKSQT